MKAQNKMSSAKNKTQKKRKPTILVSSTVYGIEELLDRIYTLLTPNYDVWMSHKGTIPVRSDRTTFKDCLTAVEKCDLFLGIITPHYGSGRDPDDPKGPSTTHQEITRAIELKKPRWILAHDHVVFARSLLNNLKFKGKTWRGQRCFKGRRNRHRLLSLEKNPILDDLRVLDLYEEAIIEVDKTSSKKTPLKDRKGNWVQKFRTTDDASTFVVFQFFRYQEVEEFIRENIINNPSLLKNGGEP